MDPPKIPTWKKRSLEEPKRVCWRSEGVFSWKRKKRSGLWAPRQEPPTSLKLPASPSPSPELQGSSPRPQGSPVMQETRENNGGLGQRHARAETRSLSDRPQARVRAQLPEGGDRDPGASQAGDRIPGQRRGGTRPGGPRGSR